MSGENQKYTGSICLTDLIEWANKRHPSLNYSEKNGKVYMNITVWVNEEKDKFENDGSIQLSIPKKVLEETMKSFGKCYLGNFKLSEKDSSPVPANMNFALDGKAPTPAKEPEQPQNNQWKPGGGFTF